MGIEEKSPLMKNYLLFIQELRNAFREPDMVAMAEQQLSRLRQGNNPAESWLSMLLMVKSKTSSSSSRRPFFSPVMTEDFVSFCWFLLRFFTLRAALARDGAFIWPAKATVLHLGITMALYKNLSPCAWQALSTFPKSKNAPNQASLFQFAEKTSRW